MYTAASVSNLMQIKDVTEEDAALIREVWHTASPDVDTLAKKYKDLGKSLPPHGYTTPRMLKRQIINVILRTYGVEFLGYSKRTKKAVYYCNAGDTYTATVLFMGRQLVVGCWGDWIERGKIKEAETF